MIKPQNIIAFHFSQLLSLPLDPCSCSFQMASCGLGLLSLQKSLSSLPFIPLCHLLTATHKSHKHTHTSLCVLTLNRGRKKAIIWDNILISTSIMTLHTARYVAVQNLPFTAEQLLISSVCLKTNSPVSKHHIVNGMWSAPLIWPQALLPQNCRHSSLFNSRHL